MGFFRFRRSIRILPGVHWNLSKGGSSFTFGRRGFKYTMGNKGARTTVGLPGTGLSYTQVHKSGAKANNPTPALPSTQMAATTQKPGMSKAGWLYVAGTVVIAIWLLGVFTNVKSPTLSQQTAPSPFAAKPESSPPVPSPTQAPGSTPEPSVMVLRATRVRSPAEEALIPKYVPARVTLRQDVEFRSRSRKAKTRTYYVGQGSEVAVVRVAGSTLVVEYAGRQARVPIIKTDFLDRVIAESRSSH